MKHYDVGIYGLWYGHNYGSIITYYALSRVIEGLGLTYAMIRNPLAARRTIPRSSKKSARASFMNYEYTLRPLG